MVQLKWIQFVRVYWPTGVLIITPILLLPIIVLNPGNPTTNCLYVLLLMAIYWTTDAIPLAITSLIPIVLFPLLGILDTRTTCANYMSEATMMFLGGLIIAMALQQSELHTRAALIIISKIGCSPKKLTMGLYFCNMNLSMWMSNTAAITIMIPITMGVLLEMENQGLCQIYEKSPQPYKVQRKVLLLENDKKESSSGNWDHGFSDRMQPSKTTLCYFLGSAFSSSIGGCGTIIGSGPNLVLKGIYEHRFPLGPKLGFNQWLFFNYPLIVAATVGTWVYLQWLYMGMFQPNSVEAQANKKVLETDHVVRQLIRKKLDDMGPMNTHQWSVAIIFCFALLAFLTRDPGFMAGWGSLFAEGSAKDTTVSLVVVVLFFILPRDYEFFKFFFVRNRSDLPKKASQSLLTWQYVHDHMEWGLIFLLGGGFSLSAGGNSSGLNNQIGIYMSHFAFLKKFEIVVVLTTIALLATAFCSNVTVANIFLPVTSEMAIAQKSHPLFFMLPVCLSCSFSFLLPVSTPPNAIVASVIRVPTREMVKAGLGTTAICMLLLWFLFPTWGTVVYPELSSYPTWVTMSERSNMTNSSPLRNFPFK